MFLSYGLYVCIILETAHHRTTFGRFCNITYNTIPEENSCKMFHISYLIVFCLMGRSRTLSWRIRIKFHLGSTKGWGRRGYGVKGGMEGEAQNKGYVLQNFHYLKQDVKFISQTVGQTIFDSPSLHLTCP